MKSILLTGAQQAALHEMDELVSMFGARELSDLTMKLLRDFTYLICHQASKGETLDDYKDDFTLLYFLGESFQNLASTLEKETSE